MNTSILEEELAQLNEQIQQTKQRLEALESELRDINTELEKFSADRQRFDTLREVCNAFDRLKELEAEELFWEGGAEVRNGAGLIEQARIRVARFEGEISGLLEKQASVQEQINGALIELEIHYDEVRDAYAREERRQDEYVVEREISTVPECPSLEAESERRFRKALLIALLSCFLLSALMIVWKLPPPVRPVVAEVPQRLVSMLRKEPPKPEPPRPKEEKKTEKDKTEKNKPEEEQEKEAKQEEPKPSTAETQAARKKAESTGVLAFRDSFKDLMDETPPSKLGAEARLTKQSPVAAGQARASRSLIAIESAGGGSGGISNAGVSRNIGSSYGNRIGGVGFTRVVSTVAGAKGEARPLSSGPGPARTDEEIQIVFDRYKATLYRMYNTELRKDPTLRGKVILRITIEPSGEVSACTVQSSDLASPELMAQIVERVKRFNFGPKDKVSRLTILYPIDFLPAG